MHLDYRRCQKMPARPDTPVRSRGTTLTARWLSGPAPGGQDRPSGAGHARWRGAAARRGEADRRGGARGETAVVRGVRHRHRLTGLGVAAVPEIADRLAAGERP